MQWQPLRITSSEIEYPRDHVIRLDKATWRGGLLAGSLFGLEFFFIAEGLQLTSAAHMSVFLYTAPIFTALGINWLLPSERLRPLQWLGIILAFAGIAFSFAGGISFADMDDHELLAAAKEMDADELADLAPGWREITRLTQIGRASCRERV